MSDALDQFAKNDFTEMTKSTDLPLGESIDFNVWQTGLRNAFFYGPRTS